MAKKKEKKEANKTDPSNEKNIANSFEALRKIFQMRPSWMSSPYSFRNGPLGWRQVVKNLKIHNVIFMGCLYSNIEINALSWKFGTILKKIGSFNLLLNNDWLKQSWAASLTKVDRLKLLIGNKSKWALFFNRWFFFSNLCHL